ncbi:NUDIX hydrolase domain-like protein, partial [Cerioporus squamosus]
MATLQLPPGLRYDSPLVETANGGASEWVEYKKVKLYTNAFVILNDAKVLLGYKKRGFGQGLWNGFGGKVDPGETPLQAAKRELEEEAGIEAPLEHCGVLFFVVDGADAAFHIDVFRADGYTGTITETDEMRPEWFSVQQDMLPPTNPLTTADHAHASQAEGGSDAAAKGLRTSRSSRYFDASNKMLRWWFGAVP